MRESTAYQAILDEGRAEGEIKGRAEGEIKGRAEEARRLLLRLGRKRWGDPDPAIEATVRAITDVERLELLAERISEVASWQELLRTT